MQILPLVQQHSYYLFLFEQSVLEGIDFSFEENILFGQRFILMFESMKLTLKLLDFFIIGLLQKIELIVEFASCKIHFLQFVFVEFFIIFELLQLLP